MNGGDHLVHGMGTELEVPRWPAITVSEAETILARFPAAGRFEELLWHSPRPFSSATLVRTDAGEFFLKRHHRSLRSPEALAPEHAFMAHLRNAGLQVPTVVASVEGVGALAAGEWTYELHGRSPGLDLYRDRLSWTPFLSRDHAHAAGVALAQLHRAANGFTAARRDAQPLIASFTIVPASDPVAAAADYIARRPALAAFLADRPWREQLERVFASLGAGLSEDLRDQPHLWTHNDWHPSNLLWSPDGTVSTVFDFGLATQTCALHDIATAIERTAVAWLEPGFAPADADTALALLAGYRTVLPLSDADIDIVVRLLPLVHVEFALSEADYFAGILADPLQADMAWQGYLLDHADWFLSAPGQAFLQQIGSGAR